MKLCSVLAQSHYTTWSYAPYVQYGCQAFCLLTIRIYKNIKYKIIVTAQRNKILNLTLEKFNQNLNTY